MSVFSRSIGIILAMTPLAGVADDLGNQIYAQMVSTTPSQAAAEMRTAEGRSAPYLKAGDQVVIAKAIIEDCTAGQETATR